MLKRMISLAVIATMAASSAFAAQRTNVQPSFNSNARSIVIEGYDWESCRPSRPSEACIPPFAAPTAPPAFYPPAQIAPVIPTTPVVVSPADQKGPAAVLGAMLVVVAAVGGGYSGIAAHKKQVAAEEKHKADLKKAQSQTPTPTQKVGN